MYVSSLSGKGRKNRSGFSGDLGETIIEIEKHYVTILGANIRYYRTLRGLRLIDLAAEAGITQSYLYKIENAYFDCNPSISVIIRLAAVLDAAPFSLLIDREQLDDEHVFDNYFAARELHKVAEPLGFDDYSEEGR